MPEIPQYKLPQVGQAGLPGVRMQPLQDPNADALKTAEDVGQLVQRARHEANVQRVEDGVNQLRAKQQEITGWVRGLRGKNAFDPKAFGGEEGQSLDQVAQARFDKASREIAGGLSNSDQRQFFGQAQARLRLEFGGHLQDHIEHQSLVMAKDSFESTMETEAQQVAMGALRSDGSLDGDTIAQSRQRVLAASAAYAQAMGFDAQTTARAATSQVHAQVLNALLDRRDAAGARVYFEEHKAEMTDKVITAASAKIQQYQQANDVQAAADEFQALPLLEAEAKVRERFAGKPELAHLVSAELEHRFNVRQTALQAQQHEVTGRLWDMRFPTVPGQQAASMADIVRSPEWGALTGDQRNDLRAKWERYARRNEDDPALHVARYATFLKLTDDPRALVGMTDAQIASHMGDLGQDLTVKLMVAKREAAGDMRKLQAASLGDLPWKDIVGEFGFKTKGTLLPDDLAKLGAIRDKAMDAIKAEQVATGKALLPERKEEILRGLLQKVKTNFGETFNHDRFLFEVTDPAQLVATKDELDQAKAILQRNGAEATPFNIGTMLNAIRARKAAK